MSAPDPSPEDTPMVMVVYQLAEIRAQLKDGFHASERRSDAIDLKIDLLTKSVSNLERWRAAVEEREKVRAETGNTVNARWVPVGVAIMSALVVVVLTLAHP